MAQLLATGRDAGKARVPENALVGGVAGVCLRTLILERILDRPLLGAGPGCYGAAFGATQARMAQDEPGVGAWAVSLMLPRSYVGEAHCDPLQWWAEYGLTPTLGLSLMIAAALVGAVGVWGVEEIPLVAPHLVEDLVPFRQAIQLHAEVQGQPSIAPVGWAAGADHPPVGPLPEEKFGPVRTY